MIPPLSFNLTLNYDFLRDTFSSGYENLHCAAWASGGLLQNDEYQSFFHLCLFVYCYGILSVICEMYRKSVCLMLNEFSHNYCLKHIFLCSMFT